jgi:hypothetical protein
MMDISGRPTTRNLPNRRDEGQSARRSNDPPPRLNSTAFQGEMRAPEEQGDVTAWPRM